MYLDIIILLIILDFWAETGDIFWLKLRYTILNIQ
jgi:hypothetical protein